MGTISLTIPQSGQSNSVADPAVASDLTTLQTLVNGNLDTNNLSGSAGILGSQLAAAAGIAGTQLAAALAQSAAVNQASQVVKGATSIATSQSTSSATYATLSTPDQVSSIVLPANGLIAVWYQATVTAAGGFAAIFLGSNQVDLGGANAPAVQQATLSTSGVSTLLATSPLGLVQQTPGSGYAGDATTGQIVGTSGAGGPCYISAAAGTYTVSIQFKASVGSVTAANRKLWVQALSFT